MFRKIKKFKNIFNLFIEYMDEKTQKLFPEIVANIDEIIEMEKKIDPDAVIRETEVKETKKLHSEMFVDNVKPLKNVKIKVAKVVDQKKGKYSHLAAARQKGIETRQRKAALKKVEKERIKAEKEELKKEKREATMQRNRDKAKARYYREKEKTKGEAKEIQEEIIKNTKPNHNNSYKNLVKEYENTNGKMDFNTFAKYMMKYENMKEAYKKSKNVKVEKKVEPVKEKKSYHSKGYPLAHLYNPANRNTEYF